MTTFFSFYCIPPSDHPLTVSLRRASAGIEIEDKMYFRNLFHLYSNEQFAVGIN